MAVTGAQITVSTIAVALNTAGSNGMWLHLRNISANAADLGPFGVTAGNGYSLPAAGTLDVLLAPNESLWAIRSAAADAVITVLRTGS